jgi:hypothetical protein
MSTNHFHTWSQSNDFWLNSYNASIAPCY